MDVDSGVSSRSTYVCCLFFKRLITPWSECEGGFGGDVVRSAP